MPTKSRHTGQCPSSSPLPSRGWTLIELMVAVLLTTLLLSIALPSYQAHLHKARRTEAHHALSRVLLAQERHRSQHLGYAESLSSLGLSALPLEHYALRLHTDADPDTASARAGYRIEALALTQGQQAKDQTCQTLAIEVRAGQPQHSSRDALGQLSQGCWPQ